MVWWWSEKPSNTCFCYREKLTCVWSPRHHNTVSQIPDWGFNNHICENMQNYCFNPMWKLQWATHSFPNSPTTQQSWYPMSQSHWLPNMNECLGLFCSSWEAAYQEQKPCTSDRTTFCNCREKKTLAAPLGMDLPLAQELKSVVCSNQTPTGNHTSTSFVSFLSTSFMTAPANVQQRQMTPRA